MSFRGVESIVKKIVDGFARSMKAHVSQTLVLMKALGGLLEILQCVWDVLYPWWGNMDLSVAAYQMWKVFECVYAYSKDVAVSSGTIQLL